MHEIQTIVIDVRDVCLSVYPSVCLSRQLNKLGFTVRGSFGAVFAKLLWSLVSSRARSRYCFCDGGVSVCLSAQNLKHYWSEILT